MALGRIQNQAPEATKGSRRHATKEETDMVIRQNELR